MTVNHLLLPPTNLAFQTCTVNARKYSAAVGVAVTAPNFDSEKLQANGWIFVAQSGPTSTRPTPSLNPIGPEGTEAGPGARYWDTTLSEIIFCDGQTWRNPAGTAV
jgi:hypothetical protein